LQEKQRARAQYRILIVDPDAEFAGLVAQTISDVGSAYTVTVSTDALTVLAQVEEAQDAGYPFDLTIADVRRPGSGSMRMLEALVQVSPLTKVITMTGQHSPELAARVQQLGVQTYLVKPVAPSRIRRLVQDELAEKGTDTDVSLTPPALSQAQQEAVERQLANVRRATSAVAALLVHTSGTLRAMDCLEPGIDSAALCVALVEAQRTIAQALAATVKAQSPIRQSYFGTAEHGICVYRLDDTHAVATLFDSAVREGQVWYCLREAAAGLQAALGPGASEASPKRDRASPDGFAMVERYFARKRTPRTRTRHSIRKSRISSTRTSAASERAAETPQAARTAPPPSEEDAAQQPPVVAGPPGSQPAPSERDLSQLVLPALLETERIQLDAIDWEVGDAQDWDTLAADADQPFHGMSLEEARQRGLLGELDPDQLGD
jgi:CheY-like chemotaxis protein